MERYEAIDILRLYEGQELVHPVGPDVTKILENRAALILKAQERLLDDGKDCGHGDSVAEIEPDDSAVDAARFFKFPQIPDFPNFEKIADDFWKRDAEDNPPLIMYLCVDLAEEGEVSG